MSFISRCLFMISLSKYVSSELTAYEKAHITMYGCLKSICLFGFNLNKFGSCLVSKCNV